MVDNRGWGREGESDAERRKRHRKFWRGVARAFGGAIFFSLPLLMTMEMWWLGFYMDRARLALFMVVIIPVLVGLDRFSGFTEASTWLDDVVDAFVAYGVGIVSSVFVLVLFNVLNTDMPLREWVGKVALQAIPASFGAVLASSQLGGEVEREKEEREENAGYAGELFLMLAGAIFFAFNVAPTEEMVLIAVRMTAWHAVLLAIVSLAIMHAVVYAVEFRGAHAHPEGSTIAGIFFRFTVAGYAIALLVSAYVLWTFGRYDPGAYASFVMQTMVLGFPAALGAAAARLII
ncbi:MAG TPA: TIGR02587 family membrane protein [Longimicrobiaceae bacterium]